MSGGKGTSSTSVPTSTQQTNPLAKYVTGAADYLTPYAQDPNRPYTAPPDPRQTAGYDFLSNTGNNLAGWPTATQYDAYGNLITGGGTSPAQPGYAQLAAGTAGPQHNADIWGYQAAQGNQPNANKMVTYADQAAAGNVGQDQLAAAAQGKYTDAASNPYLRDMVNAALRPVSENYQTSTAPTLDARFSAGGRYGSGAADQAAGSARDAFARNLGEISTGMYGKEYQFERGQQDTAAQAYDTARRQGLGLGITGVQAAGNLTDQGLRTALSAADLNQRGQIAGLGGLTTGFNTGLTTQEQALRDYNNFAAGQMIPGNADIQAGTGARDLATSVNREPYDRVNAFLKSISGAGANAAGTSSSSTTPYYTNDIASAISGLSGAASLGKQLGIGDLFSSGAGAAGLGGTFGGGGALGAGYGSIGEALAAGLPEAGFGLSEALPAAATAAATIICTELVRQGRMPNTWRLAGMRQFMHYPAIARRGYWVWATPVVAHLRRKPDSRFSKCIERTFNWRAEDLAARNGVKGARRLIRGRLVTAAMVLPCLACGLIARRDYFPSGKDAPA